jgi:diguanylate cyclase (GGDEF)-like protein
MLLLGGIQVKNGKRLIGVIISDVTAEFQSRLMSGIIEQANEYQYNVAVFSTFIREEGTTEHKHGEYNIFKLINFNQFDGIIFVPDTIRMDGVVKELEENLLKYCICPVISVNMNDSCFPKIATDEVGEFKNIVNHFIQDHKFTRINCLTGPKGTSAAMNRLEGYMEALRENNLPIEPNRIYFGDFWRFSGRDFVNQFLNSKELLPEVVICANDYMAISVCDALKDVEIRVPEDICVSGYDNIIEAGLNTPSITTYKTPIERIGKRAVKYIYEKINHITNVDESLIYGDIVLGESCGCASLKEPYTIKRDKNYQFELDTVKEDFSVINLMGENLTEVSNLQDFFISLSEHIYLLKNYKDFYLCLCDDWEATEPNKEYGESPYLKDGYTSNMRLEIAVKDREYIKDHYDFPLEDMLPALYDVDDTTKTFYFVPVHFKDRCFGYCAITFQDNKRVYDYNYRAWVRNISNALEFVRVQNNLKWCYDKLDDISVRDALTGIYNRRGFDRYAGSIFDKCVKEQTPFILLLGDLDNLKEINDLCGHVEGDTALIHVAKAFQSIEFGNPVYARIGGDEFVTVLQGDYSKQQIKNYKIQIQSYLDDLNKNNTFPFSVYISIGIFHGIPTMDTTINECITIADKKMYIEKQMKKSNSISI